MEATNVKDTKQTLEQRFVSEVVARCRRDKGFAARLRRADSPAMEYQSWELLAAYGVDLEWDEKRLPFVMVASAIAKSKVESDGKLGLGRAISKCYEDGNASDQARSRLRRVLACDDVVELCRILRPVFSLIDSRVGQPLDFTRLLQQLLRFNYAASSVKAQWAQEFYGQVSSEAEEGA